MRFATLLFYVLMLAMLCVFLLGVLNTNPGHQSKPWTERQLFWTRLLMVVLICLGVIGLAGCGGGRDTDEEMEHIHPPAPPCNVNRVDCR